MGFLVDNNTDPTMSGLDSLLSSSRRLVQLLEQPQPGLASWHMFVQERLREISESTGVRDYSGTPPIAPYVTKLAAKLVFELMPGGSGGYRQDQTFHEVTTTMGRTGNKDLIADLKRNLVRRGRHEYEIEAIEDVLIKHWRMWHGS